MARTQKTIQVADLPSIINDPERGVISLVGDSGGLSLITGDVRSSGLVTGTFSIETEHGVVYLDREQDTEISEDDGQTLSVAELDAVNDAVTTLLGERFSWFSNSDSDEQRLDVLTHEVASGIADLTAGE